MKLFNKLFGKTELPEEPQPKPGELMVKSEITDPRRIQPGQVLVAKPFLPSPYFDDTVVLISMISKTQIVGLILNKTIQKKLGELLPDHAGSPIEVFWGGPTNQKALITLHNHDQQIENSHRISANTWICADFRNIEKNIDLTQPDPEVKVFQGFSVWSPEQFQAEYQAGDWEILEMQPFDPIKAPAYKIWTDRFPGLENVDQKIYPRLVVNHSHPMYHHLKSNDSTPLEIHEHLSPVAEPFTDDLLLQFVLDMDVAYMHINQDYFEKHPAMNPHLLKRLALKNLILDVANKAEIQGDFDAVVMVTSDGNLESSLVLVEHQMNYMHQNMGNELCIAVPARDLLFICSAKNTDAVNKLKENVRKCHSDNSFQGLLSVGIYSKRAGSSALKLVGSAFE